MHYPRESWFVRAVGGNFYRRLYCSAGCPLTSELMESEVYLLGMEGCLLLILFIGSTFSKSNFIDVFLFVCLFPFIPAVIDKMSIE